jgi:isocitrate dehydrogenase kinase/phosphatase
MALEQRRPTDVVHHSDQGSQYTAVEFGRRCKEMGVRPLTGSVGDAYDNAMAESFLASVECELIERRSFQTDRSAACAIQLHRGLVQPAKTSQRARLPIARRLRAKQRTRLVHRRRVRGLRHAAGGQVCATDHERNRLSSKRQRVRER